MPAAVFDKSAKTYDVDFTHTSIGKLQRTRVYKYILPLLNKNVSVLELNCGSGYDAVQFAPYVKNILATDISEEMIRVSETAVKTAGLNNIEMKCSSIQSIKEHLKKPYHFIFSNFGGLNCLSPLEMGQLFDDVDSVQEPSFLSAFVLMSKKCWLEDVWFGWKRDSRKGRRNTSKGVKTIIEGNEFYTYYYSPDELANIAGSRFIIEKIKPVGLFIPPSYLNEQMNKRPFLFKTLKVLDMVFGGISLFANRADHYLIIFRKA